MRAHALAASFVAIAALAAGAAPSLAQPGVHPPQHAVPPMPEVFPSPMPSLPPPIRLAPAERSAARAAAPRRGGYTIVRPGFRARIAADGSIHFGGSFGGSLDVDPVHGPRASYSFDLSDSAFGWMREDPYLTEKLALMDETRPQRMEMRAAYEADLMERALADLPRYLQAVWRHPEWSSAERRRILFLLWDEAAEDGNEWLREGGERARAAIERFIATRIPPGSAESYSEGELAVLNSGRSSRRRFAPYELAGPPGFAAGD